MNENPIKMSRGTQYPVRIELTDADGNPYSLTDGERLVLGVRDLYQNLLSNYELTSCSYQAPYVSKIMFTRDAVREADGSYVITIEPEDTDYFYPGRYFYDVNLYRADGKPVNVIKMSAFDVIQSTAE